MIDIEKSTHAELVEEYNKCEAEWGKFSSDCFGYYIENLHRAIVKTGKGFKI